VSDPSMMGSRPWDKGHVEARIAEAWDEEYRTGRYRDEPPVGFVNDILHSVASTNTIPRGVYLGCGNGRNYLPMVVAGLDLVGVDISQTAIDQLREKRPELQHRLLCGSVESLPPGVEYPIVIGIQIFQHGDRDRAHSHIQSAKSRVAQGGLFCIRVNAIGTEIEFRHEIARRFPDGGFTIRYLEGPKAGLPINFFSEGELVDLFSGWEPVLPLRLQQTWRDPRSRGSWLQWEAIWRRA
jgi:SAM-dependent methyltransferase